MTSIDIVLNKLNPVALSLIKRGQVKAAILSSNLSITDKVILMKYFENNRR